MFPTFVSWPLSYWHLAHRSATPNLNLQSLTYELKMLMKLPTVQEIAETSVGCHIVIRFGAAKLHFWRKSRRKASFLNFKTLFLTFTSGEPRIEWLAITNWIPNRLTLKTIESRSCWIWNQLRLITWITPHVTLKPLDSQTNCNSIQLNLKPMESQIGWQPNPLNLKSVDNQITWNSNQLTTISTSARGRREFHQVLVEIWHGYLRNHECGRRATKQVQHVEDLLHVTHHVPGVLLLFAQHDSVVSIA